MIDDSRARKLASDLKRCSYYETCATYGLNVERVFQDGKFIGFLSLCKKKNIGGNEGVLFNFLFWDFYVYSSDSIYKRV